MLNQPITSVFNDGYVAEVYEAYKRDPAAVDESWRQFFGFAESLAGTVAPVQSVPVSGSADPSFLRKVAAAAKLCHAIREYGHFAVALDPLGTAPQGTIELTTRFHGLTDSDLATIPGGVLAEDAEGATGADVVQRLRSFYSSNIGFEFDHLGQAEEREWIRREIESGRVHQDLGVEEKKALLRRLTEVDGLERFIGRVYQGYKRFSIEGTDMLVPMLDAAIEYAAVNLSLIHI